MLGSTVCARSARGSIRRQATSSIRPGARACCPRKRANGGGRGPQGAAKTSREERPTAGLARAERLLRSQCSRAPKRNRQFHSDAQLHAPSRLVLRPQSCVRAPGAALSCAKLISAPTLHWPWCAPRPLNAPVKPPARSGSWEVGAGKGWRGRRGGGGALGGRGGRGWWCAPRARRAPGARSARRRATMGDERAPVGRAPAARVARGTAPPRPKPRQEPREGPGVGRAAVGGVQQVR